jgi:hypothetical protein
VSAYRSDHLPLRLDEAGGARLLLVFGEDKGGTEARPGRRRYNGATDFHRLLGDLKYERLTLGRRLPFAAGAANLSAYACIVNMMTDPELHRQPLENLRRLLAGYGGKIVNRPQAVLQSGRDKIAAALAGTPGLRVPKVARLAGGKPRMAVKTIERLGVAYPLIVRQAGTHTGNIVGLIESEEALLPAIARAGDYFATEFVDYRSADGLFRKYRVFFLGERIVFRHMIISDEWSVHGGSRMRFMVDRRELMEEEKRLFSLPEGPFPADFQTLFGEIRSRIALDFFGLDFGIDRSGEAVLFEANATMNFFPPVADPRFDYLMATWPAARDAFRDLVLA